MELSMYRSNREGRKVMRQEGSGEVFMEERVMWEVGSGKWEVGSK